MTPDDLRSSLSALAGAGVKAARAGESISNAAAERHGAVMARMSELSPDTLSDPAAAEEYSTLVRERGQLDVVLGQERS
ncbi:hypothetical protein [Parvibaculum sp.]|uniref:hypothetical protein n=1 Tax=Parvibaculum sp. TaxID=2024848 RepID=UPI0027349FDC|nr:hypothetical protein [Parvibaculum sp.]MDP3327188.1 hypothetical protein [Parvibaculum sp.]